MKLPLIFFTLLFILIVFLRWRASKPKEEPKKTSPVEKETKPEPKKGGKGFVFAGLILVCVSAAFLGYSLLANFLFPTAKPAPAPVISQNWQLCWEKKPEHGGKTGMRNHCIPAKIETRTSSYLVISYNGNSGKGVQEGTSIDGVSYSGGWKDPTGWGKFHLRFTSSDTAFGWLDDEDKGEKIPNVLEKI